MKEEQKRLFENSNEVVWPRYSVGNVSKTAQGGSKKAVANSKCKTFSGHNSINSKYIVIIKTIK